MSESDKEENKQEEGKKEQDKEKVCERTWPVGSFS